MLPRGAESATAARGGARVPPRDVVRVARVVPMRCRWGRGGRELDEDNEEVEDQEVQEEEQADEHGGKVRFDASVK